MANEGPTTVGSIDAKVGMDLDQWRADVAVLKAQAEELRGVSPEITVDANTSRAQAAMAAVHAQATAMGASASTAGRRVKASADDVAAAEAKVAVAASAADSAYARVALAQQRVNELRDTGTRKASTLMAAELALTEAVKRLDTANEKATASETALAAAQEAARATAQQDATAESENAAATTNAGNAAGYTNTRMVLLTAAVAGLALIAAPLTGTVVGLAGALAGLGVAGVLGIIGVVQAMKQANQVGDQYSSGLKLLKSDLDALAGTAALSLLGSFQQSVKMINADMPELNGQVQWLGSELGVIGTTVLTGVINALHILNPLFSQSTRYVQSLASGFASWTADGGLQKFAQFAETTFPLVTGTIGDLVSAAVHLVTALAPIGIVLLNIVDGAAGLLGLLGDLGPGLGIVAGAAAAAFAAFKLWETVGPILSSVTTAAEAAAGGVTALGIAMDTASGPIGWVIAGVSALTAAVGIGIAATQQNTVATNDYTAALQQSKGAIDANVRSTVAKNLSDSGVLETAKKYHLQLSTVTDAVLGNADAMKTVTDATNKYGGSLLQTEDMHGNVTSSTYKYTTAAQKLLDTVDGNNKSLKEQVQAYKDTESAASGSTAQVNDLKTAEDNARTATDKFAQALQGLGNVNLSANQASIQYQQSLADLNTAIDKNGKTLDVTTQAGRDNMSALDQIASSATALIAAEAKQGTSEQDLQANMAASRTAFINAAEAAGATADQANHLADQYGLIPSNVDTAYQTSGAQDAIDKANRVKAAIDAIPTYLPVTISTHGTMISNTGHLVAFAGGGTVHGPGSRTADRVTAALSDTEEVTSNDRGQADKWRSLLKMVNADAPAGQIAGKAMQIAGVQAPAQVVAGGPGVVHNHYWQVYSSNPKQMYDYFTAQTNAKEGP
ncbi:hypothetical protein [Humibacter sp.]|uniref:hypothetical protein n=1 Tax=Humibacter sp. TaxID=1940291 RepID=UPI003F7E34D5